MKVTTCIPIVVALAGVACCGAGGTGDIAGGHPMGRSGPEQWTVEGQRYAISDTYVLALPEGMQYTIEYPYDPPDGSPPRPRTVPNALRVACPLMRDALATGRYKTKDVNRVGHGKVVPDHIGVVIFERTKTGSSGFRMGLAISDIPIRCGPPPTSPSSSAPPATSK